MPIQPGQTYRSADPRELIRIRIKSYVPGENRALVVDAATGKRPRPMLVTALHDSPTTQAGKPRRSGYVLETAATDQGAARTASGQQPECAPWIADGRHGPTPEELRQRIARAIHRYDNHHALSGNDMPSEHHYGEADAVLAVLDAEQPDPTTADDPTPLRWGHDDVLHGDDDTVTVCLSGPNREPYWLELDPERAAALRDDLAAPAVGQPAEAQDADEALTASERQFLHFALDAAEHDMAYSAQSQSDEDKAALARLRRMAGKDER